LLQQFPENTPGAVLPNLVMAEDGASARVADDKIVHAFYHDVDVDTADWAISKLVPQAAAPFATPVMTTVERFGAIAKTYIECTADNAIPIAVQRAMQRKWPVETILTMDTSHSPFFSQPEQLAQHLMSL
jgi:pimeloyl-ACP methyl ester carboxylesterase